MDRELTVMARTVRIGCGAGFWGDSPDGPRQLVQGGGIDYLVMDYLAEITMSILARARTKRPELGYATDFVDLVMRPLLREIAQQGIKVVTNAGGLNPAACAAALREACAREGVSLRIATVHGDDLADRAGAWRAGGATEMFTGQPLPDTLTSANAYLGALPIARALDAGADVVLTGRCVDSALVLGPLIHEFGWAADDYDRLSGGSLAGHLIECGCQVTGGIVTDWGTGAGWDDMGFPVAECDADGTCVITKPAGTGGRVDCAGVAEQAVYEVGDPAAYLLPDVICDWSAIRLAQVGPDCVRVSGAKGRAPCTPADPAPRFKVCATWQDGYRMTGTMTIIGRDAVARAQATGNAILARAGRFIAAAGVPPFTATAVEVIGSDSQYGRHARGQAAREVVLSVAARHASRQALEILAREIYPAATAMAQGTTGFAGGRPSPQPLVCAFSLLVPQADVPVWFELDGARHDLAPVAHAAAGPVAMTVAMAVPALDLAIGEQVMVPLIAIAFGRSGDKGDLANVGVLARDPRFVGAMRRALTPAAIADRLDHFVKGPIEVFEWPGLHGFNVVLHQALGGGGTASLRHDPQGKALAQILMDMPVAVPATWLKTGLIAAEFDA
ncbi:acyclic terpene utilization AtuA family protein [Novosphingobium sp.]|uniref:acyclic terpene utilization AtuA family protein n=1 Tax=Novosphingobium sp. TaxID=1874826 RepID=UPI00334092E4